MFVHIDSRIFDKRPFLGILLGAATLVAWLYFGGVVYAEYKGMGSVPAIVDLSKVVAPPENHGKWVRIDQAVSVHCDLTYQQVQYPPESWIFGRVDETFFVASIDRSDRNVLLVHGGELSCGDASRNPLEGVLEEINSRRRATLTGGGLTFPPHTDIQLSLGESPATYRKILLLGSFLPCISIACIVLYVRKWRAKVRQEENLSASLWADHAHRKR